MKHKKTRSTAGAKESTWSDDDSFLSSESSDNGSHRYNPPNDANPIRKSSISLQPLQPPISPSPLASSLQATGSSSARSQKKKKKKGGKKKHKKSKKASMTNLPSTSRKHRKNPSSMSKRKIHPVPVDEQDSSNGDPAPVTMTATLSSTLPDGFMFSSSSNPPVTNVVYSAPISAEETENTIAMAVREIRRYRERIAELEMLVRHLSESYGVDPESLLMAESLGASAGSCVVLRKGTRGLRVSVEGSHNAEASSQELTNTDEISAQIVTPSTTMVTPTSQMPGVVLPDLSPQGRRSSSYHLQPPVEPQLSEEQKMTNIMIKLQKLTGRKMSLEEISPLLHARTADEALRNGRMLRTAEHLKRVYGGRPENYVFAQTQPSPPPQSPPPPPPQQPAEERSSPVHAHQHNRKSHPQSPKSPRDEAKHAEDDLEPVRLSSREKARLRKKKSRSVFDFTSLNPIDGEDDEENRPSTNTGGELVGESTFGRKIEKLTRLTGRRGSISEIRGLLLPANPEEAKKYAQSLYTMEKLKKRYGERPTIEQTPQQQ